MRNQIDINFKEHLFYRGFKTVEYFCHGQIKTYNFTVVSENFAAKHNLS
jgi:hypothetical protein